MSPNETQLRAALRDGEGDHVDVGQVIAEAVSTRAHRRQRINAAIAGAGVVAVIGLGIGALVAGGIGAQSGGGSSAGGAATGSSLNADFQAQAGSKASAAAGGAGGAGRASAPSSSISTFAGGNAPMPPKIDEQHPAVVAAREYASEMPCEAVRHDVLDGNGTRKNGADGDLFLGPPLAMKVCVYENLSTAPTRSVVLSGSAASMVGQALEVAPSRRGTANRCTTHNTTIGTTLVLESTYVQAGKLVQNGPVTIAVRCGLSVATDGTAVRYLPNLPAALLDIAARAAPGRATGSPIHS